MAEVDLAAAALQALAIALAVGLLACLVRIARGPSARDRVTGVVLAGTTGAALLAVATALTGEAALLTGALITVALALVITVVTVSGAGDSGGAEPGDGDSGDTESGRAEPGGTRPETTEGATDQ